MLLKNINEIKNIKTLWHETGSADLLNSYRNLAGLNVASEPEMALGQSGKGFLYEFDKEKLLGEKGFLRSIVKPGTDFVGLKEFEVGSGNPDSIKSITIKPNTKLSSADFKKLSSEIKSGRFIRKNLSDGSIKLIKNIGKTVGKAGSIATRLLNIPMSVVGGASMGWDLANAGMNYTSENMGIPQTVGILENQRQDMINQQRMQRPSPLQYLNYLVNKK